jgi:hypothetical protein
MSEDEQWEHPDLGVMTLNSGPRTLAQTLMGLLIIFGAAVLIVWTVLAVFGVIDVTATETYCR